MTSSRSKWLWVLASFFIIFTIIIPFVSRSYLTDYAKSKAEELMNSQITLGSAELFLLSGSVVINDLKVFHPVRKKEVYIEAEQVQVRVKYLPMLFGDRGAISIKIDEPKMTFATDRSGHWELARQVPLFRRGSGEKRLPLNIDEIKMNDGLITYIDNKVSQPPKITTVNNIELHVKKARLATAEDPLPADVNLTFRINDQAKTKLTGKADFLSPKISFDANVTMSGLSVPPFAPYYDKSSMPVYITQGILSLDSHAVCKKNWLQAPTNVVISQLAVQPKPGKLTAIPAQAVVDKLKDSDGTLRLTMMVAGDIQNPRFVLTSAFTQAFIGAFSKELLQGLGDSLKGVTDQLGGEAKSGLDKLKGLFH